MLKMWKFKTLEILKIQRYGRTAMEHTLSKRGICQILGTSWILRMLAACERPQCDK